MEEPQPNDARQTLSYGVQNPLGHLKALATRALRWWQTLKPRYKKLLLGLGVSVVLIVVILAIWKIPQRQLAPLKAKIQRERANLTALERLKLEHDARKLENDARTTLLQAVGGLVLLIGLYFTAKTWRTAQEGQVTDRFTRAINQLGEVGPEKLAVRLGGIYALERISRESKMDYWPIMELLAAYIREHAPWPPSVLELAEEAGQKPKPAADIAAILAVFGRRPTAIGRGLNESIDLGEVDLRGADLVAAHLERVNFSGAHLEGAALHIASLHLANFWDAHLEGASLEGANMSWAMLLEAHLKGAVLRGARLDSATLVSAHMEKADLRHANLKNALLPEAHLDGAILAYAHLEGAVGLTVEQLSTVRTLYQAHLDPPLLEQIRQQYPQLLKESSLDGIPEETINLVRSLR
jgi:Type II secretion system (T2SS), protein M/Pentapeptide repeats (8 copies)